MQDNDSLGSSSPSSSSSIRQAIQASLRTYNAETQAAADHDGTEDDLDSVNHEHNPEEDDDVGSPVRFRSRDSSSSESSSDEGQWSHVRQPTPAFPTRPVASPPPPVERPPIGRAAPTQLPTEREPSPVYRGGQEESALKNSPNGERTQQQRTIIPQSAIDRLTSASKISPPKEPPAKLYSPPTVSRLPKASQPPESSPPLIKKSPPTAAPVRQKFPAPQSPSSAATLTTSAHARPTEQTLRAPGGDHEVAFTQDRHAVKESDTDAPYITEEDGEDTKQEEGPLTKKTGEKDEKREEKKRPPSEEATYTYHPDWGAWGRAVESLCSGSVCDWCWGSSVQPCPPHIESYALRPVYRAHEPESYRYHADAYRHHPVRPMTHRTDVAVFGDGSRRRAWREVVHPKRVPEFSGWETFDYSYGGALPGTPVRVIQERECLGGCVRWNEAYNGYIAGHEWPVPPPRMGYCEEQTTIPWYPQLLFYQSHE